ncbi:MarR family winged helix-turn-helix transcriptional regulator [Pseudonocardia sp. CA-107938]|uniref:MarR family winged helix-turn-helix transcriptional regulator n=1 Tax=Pseudonocardia sp. CA-107938 TaxID=3240021 RepID=UPI003D8AB6DC
MELDDRGVYLLSHLGYHVADRFAHDLAPLGLQPAQFGVLTHLARSDGRSQQELADQLGVHRNAMVGIVDALEGRGYVRRARHPLDRRAHAVHLTESGRTALDAARAVADELEASVLTPLDAAEQASLIAMLHRLVDHAGLPPGVHPALRTRLPRV